LTKNKRRSSGPSKYGNLILYFIPYPIFIAL
jgi:hypothetical protein